MKRLLAAVAALVALAGPSVAFAQEGSRGGSSQTSNYFNPSVSLIGNFLAVGGSNSYENLPSASLRESEVGLQAIVDPYARADVFLSFGESSVNVEEGYVSFTSLPWGLLVKVGRMRTMFGKINTLHLHVLPWPDEPLPNVNLLGGEEGWIGDGVSIAKLIPLGNVFSELTLQGFSGDSGDLFTAPKRSDLAYNAHYKIFADMTEASNLEIGLSYGSGPNGETPTSRTDLQGLDLTYRWRPLQQGNYRGVIAHAEYIRSVKDLVGGRQTADGFFVSEDTRFARRWYTGARYERSARADDGSAHDDGQALTLTFWPSEFSQLRAELRRRHYAEGITGKEILLQVQFAIGAHGAHPF